MGQYNVINALGTKEMTYGEFVMQFREGFPPFNGNQFMYCVMMWDVFKFGSEKPTDITKFRAIDYMTEFKRIR